MIADLLIRDVHNLIDDFVRAVLSGGVTTLLVCDRTATVVGGC